MLYIPSYRCNVACSTMCTERLVRLTIERYVLLVAHIIRRCTTCSIEKFSSYNCQGIKTIVHTLNYYTRIPSPCFWFPFIFFPQLFFLFLSFLFQRPGTRIASRRQSEIGTVSGVYISVSWRETSFPLKKIELSRSVRSIVIRRDIPARIITVSLEAGETRKFEFANLGLPLCRVPLSFFRSPPLCPCSLRNLSN